MGKKILLADDSITIQKVIELTFSDEDFDVVTVGNGRLAIERLEEVRPDVVLCDIIMPEKDGYEVCDFIKKNAAFSHVPVLLLTGAFEPFDQERAARVGCDGYLAKPFEPQALIAKVKDLLLQSASRPRAAAPVAVAPPAPASLSVDDEWAQTLPGTAPTSLTQPEPVVSAPEAPAPFVPEDEPVVEEAPAGTFDAPMDLSTDAAPPYAPTAGLEQELYSMDEPVVAAPEEFMPLMAEEAQALQPPPSSGPIAFESDDEPVFDSEPVEDDFVPAPAFVPASTPSFVNAPAEPPAAVAPPPPVFEPPPPPPVFEPAPAPDFEAAPAPVFEAPPPPPVFAPPPPAVEPVPPMAAPVFEPPPSPPVRPLEPASMVEEDDGASTVVFRSGEAPPWSQPTTELSFEMRAQAMAKQQAEESPAPVFEDVAEDEPEPFEPPPPPPVFEPVAPPAPAFEPFVAHAPAHESVFEAAEPEPEPEPEPVVAAPEPEAVPDEQPEESFAALAPPAVAPVDEPAAPASAAAEVAVPVDQVAQIAQRVVAQISEKVVREIAWEIIPDLAEALIKKEIERLKAELERT